MVRGGNTQQVIVESVLLLTVVLAGVVTGCCSSFLRELVACFSRFLSKLNSKVEDIAQWCSTWILFLTPKGEKEKIPTKQKPRSVLATIL